jgi:tight adherence protein B
MTELVAFVCFVLLISPVVMNHLVRRKERLERELTLRRRLGDQSGNRRSPAAPAPRNPVVERLVARVGALPWVGDYLGESLRRADTRMLLTIPASPVAAAIVSARWLSLSGTLSVPMGAIALPLLYLLRRRKQWLKLLSEQMPYLIDLLKSGLESGHTMLRALRMASQNLPEPTSNELRVVVEQVQLGMTLPLALEAMHQRAPIEELGFLVAAVRIQSDVGNSLAEVLQHVSEGMRNRQRAEQQLRALTAQSRASAIIVTLLPFIVLAALALINPGYPGALFYNEVGKMMLKTAVVLDIVAFFVMRRIGRVNY